MFACQMYGPTMSHAESESRVDEVIESLGLESCRDTKVRNYVGLWLCLYVYPTVSRSRELVCSVSAGGPPHGLPISSYV